MYINDIYTDNRLVEVVRQFFTDPLPPISMSREGDVFAVTVSGREFTFDYSDDIYGNIPSDRKIERLSKIALYDALTSVTGRAMPWGALTGVRPSKLFYECLNGGKTQTQAADIMSAVYRVSRARACILRRIEYAQRGKVFFPDDQINLYVHIPYCTTRCSYCSFVSAPISKCVEQSRIYTDLVSEEIVRSVDFLRAHGKNILSVYIGGGTPTALAPELLDKILCAIGDADVEYTCEAGRPDTISREIADILLSHKVNRVCVNPQTLVPRTLVEIGRAHTVDDFYRAYEIVRDAGFIINCDLIAGLGSETVDDFASSFEGIRALAPDNITVHTLARKNGAKLRYVDVENEHAAAMVEYAFEHLGKYRPYYLYRQKRQSGNLENVGFSIPGKECINNITTMEETVGVMACGAGAISKYVTKGNIARFANMRDVELYIGRFEEKLNEKLDFFAKNFKTF